MCSYEKFKLDKEILDILEIPDLLYTNQMLLKKLVSKWRSNNVILNDDLKNFLHYPDNVKSVQLSDIFNRIKINHIQKINYPPNCTFYSYDQKPIY
jgi:hypothetical protein